MYFLVFIIWELVRFVCVCVCVRVHHPVRLPAAVWVVTALRAVDWITSHANSSV